MQSKSFLVLSIVLLAHAACGGSPHVDATGAGGGGPGGSSGSGGAGASVDGAAGQGGAAAPVDASGAAGNGGLGGQAGDDRLFVPEGLPDTNQDGQDEGLVLVAFTLVPGANGPSFYAAVQNVSSTPICEAGMMLTFFDQNNQLVGTSAGVLQSGRFDQLGDGTVIPCVDPGQIAMTGATGLPSTIVVDQLGALQHVFPAFVVDVLPFGGLTVTGVQPVANSAGTAYTGTVVNSLGSTLSNPSVTIFPVNRVGRPLGMATASATVDLAPGGTWNFQTTAVDDPGVDQAAYASGSLP